MRGSTVAEAYAVCEMLAEERARTTKVGDFADGYRCAATHIATAIRREREGHGRTELERDLRDAEVEARALGRVVAVAADVVDNAPDSRAADAVREVLASFFADDDLPRALRRRTPPCESTTRLMTGQPTRARRH